LSPHVAYDLLQRWRRLFYSQGLGVLDLLELEHRHVLYLDEVLGDGSDGVLEQRRGQKNGCHSSHFHRVVL
jgi:hypothetical protein